jgi:hypothetical protein
MCPQIPKPMHGVAPREILGSKWWNETRQAAYRSTGYHCLACGIHKSLAAYRQWMEGHEWYEIDYRRGRMTYKECIPLCHFCHNYIHIGRLQALLEKGEIHQAKFVVILQHGDRVLREVGLVRNPPYDGPFAEWSDWRLVIDGREYPPKFKTFEAWQKHFS